MWTFIVVAVLLTAGLAAQDYGNRLRGILRHACPDKHAVSQINSSYSATDQDRQWKFECKALGSTSDCSWSTSQDSYDTEHRYHCPVNRVVTGVFSDFDMAQGARSWKFLCCSVPNFVTSECRKSPLVNYWSKDFTWRLPAGHFLTGVQTHLKNRDTGDHRWSFNYCKGKTQDTQTVNSQILRANKPVANLVVEGDVIVSNTRNARICSDCRWEKLQATVQVPFIVSDSFTSSEKDQIAKAISAFHMSTCIRFVAHTNQPDYISIVKKRGCWSWVGRIGMSQEVSLGAGCLQSGIIQHELIHALGFWHEQSRTDRDAFVKINLANIQDGQERNFDRLDTNNLNVPYDYSSLMHYAPRDFSKNGEDTIVALDPSAQIGQREGMSEKDILKINKLYVCTDYLHAYNEWDNVLENTLSRTCPTGQAVSGITSLYNSEKNDRLWAFSCKALNPQTTCQWSRSLNNYWEPFNFNCGGGKVISGAYAEHSRLFQDRRWRFQCCSSPGFTTSNCYTETHINYFQEYFSWTVPSDHFLTGVQSSFDRPSGDRQWSVTYCQGNGQ